MKFFFYPDDNGEPHRMDMSEVREHLSKLQIKDVRDAKRADPEEDVRYLTIGGVIVVEL